MTMLEKEMAFTAVGHDNRFDLPNAIRPSITSCPIVTPRVETLSQSCSSDRDTENFER